MPIIDLVRVSKCFHLYPDRPRSLQELALQALRRPRWHRNGETLWALRDVSFGVEPGQTVGIIGSNGSGKSTCLKLLTRIIQPTSGQVRVQGRVAALLELGAGFHPELTGRENIFLQGAVQGMSRREMVARLDEIVAFAELERFIDVPVKVYSSGMYVRLAFATAIHVQPDVLLVDEVLAVGDQSFQHKCMERIYAMKAQGVTIVLVSHDLAAIRSVCERAIWLNEGRLADDGVVEAVVSRYLQHEYEQEQAVPGPSARGGAPLPTERGAAEPQPADATPTVEGEPADARPQGFHAGRWGSGEATIEEVQFLDDAGRPSRVLSAGQPMTVALRYHARQRIERPVFGVAFYRNDGLHLSGSNTRLSRFDLSAIEGSGTVRYRMEVLPFLAGAYYLTAAIHSADESRIYDYHSLGWEFRVRLGQVAELYGTVYVPGRWAHDSAAEEEAQP